ncbi:MAG: DUF4410 domain-containing protein [Sedimentisphaerales bacterium]|nr:DUF4410 domain-containing protein [Sedimentisphaerales bacterium]
MKHKSVWAVLVYTIIAFIIVGLSGCATSGGGEQKESAVQSPPVQPLEKHYSELIIYEIETTPELKNDYKQELKDCHSTLISSLLKRNKYKRVEAVNSNETYGSSALLVKIKVSDMRITSFAARFWVGGMAGNSYMNMRMMLVDAETGDLVRDEDFDSTNSAVAAAWNFGASDRSLPTDMAEIMADYLDKAVQP